ncbi:MAG: hypothetical protein GY795_00510 [Desulfobacterales bacterium]|nr:hypothetical protein [Desulfobacterales bacterium]
MESFRLIFEPDSISRSKAGSITARIVIQIGGFIFPGAGWSDFIVVILGWWLQAIRQIGISYEEGCLQFMDGPYKVLIRTVNEHHSELICLEERHTEIKKYCSIVETDDIKNELVRISREIVSLCDKNSWSSDDIVVLRKEIDAMESVRKL